MRQLLIIGARGWGREVLWNLRNYPMHHQDFEIKGFLDSDEHILDGLKGDFPPIISSVEDYKIQPDDIFFCAMGDPYWRKHYSDIVYERGGEFITYISPHAAICPSATIGDGSFICGTACISDNVTIGRQAIVNCFSTLGHDVKIGDYVTIEAYSFFGGYAEVGDLTSIHVRSTILRHKKVGCHASVGAASVVIRNVKDHTNVFGNPAKKTVL